jgi:chaperone required for assembly of F1-ATPase
VSRVAARRFYRHADIVSAGPDVWGIALDGKLLRSPAQAEFSLPGAALARAIAGEWAEQGDRILPATMPLMQLAATAIDLVPKNRVHILAELSAISDLVCYRAREPAALVARQQAELDPLIAWVSDRFGVSVAVTSAIAPAILQPKETSAELDLFVAGLDDFALTALSAMVRATGSLVVALALFEGHLSPAEAARAAHLEELYQAERWGRDPEAERRRQADLDDLVAAHRFMTLLRQRA